MLDAQTANNYLNDKELDILNRIVSMYLDYAELQAIEQNTMTMNDWIKELNYFLTMNRKDITRFIMILKTAYQYAVKDMSKEETQNIVSLYQEMLSEYNSETLEIVAKEIF